MKIFVINLDRREDRLSYMSDQLQGYDWTRFSAIDGHSLSMQDINSMGFTPANNWIDPLLGRPHTYTDLAAMISHYKIWEVCSDINEPVLILEDDVERVGDIDFDELKKLLNVWDIAYLDYREMFEDRIVDFNNEYFIPYYPYLNSAYAITPHLARKIISSEYKNNLIPVDEFFPSILGVNYNETCLSKDSSIRNNFIDLQNKFQLHPIRSIAFKKKIFKQVSRSILGSDIESGSLINMNKTATVLTVGTDEQRLHLLYKTANKFNIDVINLGKGVEWRGGSINGPACGQKLNLVKDKLQSLSDDEIVLFCDGYDVIFNDNLDSIVSRFLEFNVDVVIGAEKNCWPDKSLSTFFESETEYKFLNSGLYIGYVRALKEILSGEIKDSDDDQLYMQRYYIANKIRSTGINIELDKECYLFQNYADASEDVSIASNGQLRNSATRCRPLLLHGNGGSAEKEKFFKFIQPLVRSLKLKDTDSIIEYIKTNEAKVIGPEILEMEFMSPEMCYKLIDIAEKHNNWESMYGDKFPGQEVRIRNISVELFDELETAFMNSCRSAIESYWSPTVLYGLRDAFIIKYSPDTQKSLNCHNDASMVSGMVKLNDDYTGGDTYFYRQNFSNINTKQGNIILWPSQVTHGHEGREVTSGIKYNLVIWTRRMKNDINY